MLDQGRGFDPPKIFVLRVYNTIVKDSEQGSFGVQHVGTIDNITLPSLNMTEPIDIGGYVSPNGTQNILLLLDKSGLKVIGLKKTIDNSNGLPNGNIKMFDYINHPYNDTYYRFKDGFKIDSRSPIGADLGAVLILFKEQNTIISFTCADLELNSTEAALTAQFVNEIGYNYDINNLAYMQAEEKWYMTDYTGKLHKFDKDGRFLGGGGTFGVSEGGNELYYPTAITPNPIGDDPTNNFRYRFMVANRWSLETGIKLLSPGIFVSKLKAFENLNDGDLTFAFTMSGKWGYIEGAQSIKVSSIVINTNEVMPSLWNTQIDAEQTDKSKEFLNSFPETIKLSPLPTLLRNANNDPIVLKRGWNTFKINIEVKKILEGENVTENVTKTINFYWLPSSFTPSTFATLDDLKLNNAPLVPGTYNTKDYIYKPIELGDKGVFYVDDSHPVWISEYGDLHFNTGATLFNTSYYLYGMHNYSFFGTTGKLRFDPSSYICANGNNNYGEDGYRIPSNQLVLDPAYKKGINPSPLVIDKFSAADRGKCKSACEFLAGTPVVTFTATVDLSNNSPFKVTVDPKGSTYFNKLKWEVEEVGNVTKKASLELDATAPQVINLNEKLKYNNLPYTFLSCKDYKITLTIGCNNASGQVEWLNSFSKNVGIYNDVKAGPDQTACEYDSPLQMLGFTPVSVAGDGTTPSWTAPTGTTITSAGVLNLTTYPTGLKNVPQTFTYNYTDKWNCTRTATKKVIVYARPATPATLTTNSPVCEGGTINLTTSVLSGAKYQWTLANNQVLESATNTTSLNPATLAMAGTVKGTVILNGCSSLDKTALLGINPLPTITIPEPVKNLCRSTGVYPLLATATFPVVWKDLVGVTANGSNLTKTGGTANVWDAGAFSNQSITNGGYVEGTSSENNTYKMLGLNTSNVNPNFNTLRYAIYFSAGTLNVFENGVNRNIAGVTFAVNDIAKIAVVGNVVKYYKNGTVFYTSTIVPTYPLYADVSLYSTNATLKNVNITAGGNGVWSGNSLVVDENGQSLFITYPAGIGEHMLTYTHTTSSTGCSKSATQKMVIGPKIELGSEEYVCLNTPAFEPSVVSPKGGTWSISGVNLPNNLFVPTAYTTSQGGTRKNVGYSYTDQYGCTETANKSIYLYPTPMVNISPTHLVGLRYKYYENLSNTAWTTIPNFNTLAPVAEGTATTINATPSTLQRTTNFGLVYEGFLTIPTTGTYTFYLNSKDGSRLYLNNSSTAIITNNKVQAATELVSAGQVLNAGLIPIKIEYFNGSTTGASLSFSWAGPSIAKQIVPSTAFTSPLTFCQGSSLDLTASDGSSFVWSNGVAAGPVLKVEQEGNYSVIMKNSFGCTATSNFVSVKKLDVPSPSIFTNNGLRYKYYENNGAQWAVLPNFNTLTPVKSGHAYNLDYLLRNRENNYGFLFEGYIIIPADGVYTFYTNSDDGSQLFINNNLIVNNDGDHPAQERSGNVSLLAGIHLLKVTYFNGGGGQALTVMYESATIPKQVIPSRVLFNSEAECLLGSLSMAASVGTAFKWNTAATTRSIPFTTAGNYSVEVTGTNGCKATASKNIATTTAPTVAIVTSTPNYVCSGSFTSGVLIASPTGSAPFTYVWKNNGIVIAGATAQSYTITANGSYTVTATDACGQVAISSPFVFEIITQPNFVLSTDIRGASPTMCANGGTANIRADITGYNNAKQYELTLQPTNQVITSVTNAALSKSDAFTTAPLNTAWRYLNTNALPNSNLVTNGRLQLNGKHAGVSSTANDFTAVWRDDMRGNVLMGNVVKVTSLTSTSTTAKAGIMLTNDMRTLSRGGYCLVALTASNTIMFQYDANGDGLLEGSVTATLSAPFAGLIHIKRIGNVFSAFYTLTDPASTWVQIGSNITISSALSSSQVGLFTSSHTVNNDVTATFDNFNTYSDQPLLELPITASGIYNMVVKDKTGNNTCTPKNANITIISKPNPVVTATLSKTELCFNAEAFKLTGGLPVNGIWSGTRVSKIGADYFFTPSVSNVGNNVLTYSFTATNGCSNSANVTMKVSNISPPSAFDLGPNQEVVQGKPITLNVNIGSGNTILWSTGETTPLVNVSLDYLNPVKTITATISNPCGQAMDNIILTVPCPRQYFVNAAATIKTPVLGNFDGTEKVYTGGGVFDGVYYVVGDILLKNGTFTLNPGTVFYVEENKQIRIGDGGVAEPISTVFNMYGATATAACSKMWGGIYTYGKAVVNMGEGGNPIQKSLIKDAVYGFRIAGTATNTNWLTTLDIQKTKFINNYYGVYADNDAKTSLKIQYSLFDSEVSQMKPPYNGRFSSSHVQMENMVLSGFDLYHNEMKNCGIAILFTNSTHSVFANITNNFFTECSFAIHELGMQGNLNFDQNDIDMSGTNPFVGISINSDFKVYPIGSNIKITNNQFHNSDPLLNTEYKLGIGTNVWGNNYHEIKANYFKGLNVGIQASGNTTSPISFNNFINCKVGFNIAKGWDAVYNLVCNNFEDNVGIIDDYAIQIGVYGAKINFKPFSGNTTMNYNVFSNISYSIYNGYTSKVEYHKAFNDLTSSSNVFNTQIITEANGVAYGSVDCGAIAGIKPGINFETPIDIGNIGIGANYSNTQNNSSINGFLNDYYNVTGGINGQISDDIFYKFTLTQAAKVSISHCNSELYDTYLHLFNANRTLLHSVDDYGPICNTSRKSSLSMNLAAGVYYIASEGYSSSSGNITTQLTVEACADALGNTIANPIVVSDNVYTCFTYSDTKNNAACFGNEFLRNNSEDIYYKFTLTQPFTLTFSTCNSGFDTFLSILDANGTLLEEKDDWGPVCPEQRASSMVKSLAAGTYYLVVEGYGNNTGWITTTISDRSSLGCVQAKKEEFVPEKDDINNMQKISIHPNPTQNVAYLKISNFKESTQLSLMDISGRIVHQQQVNTIETEINTSQLSAGTYYLSFVLNSKVINKKLVVVK